MPVTTERIKEKSNVRATKNVAKCLLVLLSTYYVFADSKLDILGDKPKAFTTQEYVDKKESTIKSAYSTLTPRNKFASLYLNFRDYSGDGAYDRSVTMDKKGNGILGAFATRKYFSIEVNGSDCLYKTAWNIDPDAITGRANGVMSSAATLTMESEEQGTLKVSPSGNEDNALIFTDVNGPILRPANDFTRATLSANGCPTFDGINKVIKGHED